MDSLDGVPDGYRVTIHQDEDAESPRQMSDDHVHVLTVPTDRYVDVDKDPGPWGPQWRSLLDRYNWSRAIEIMVRYAALVGGFVHEHAPHDGARSLWYLTREDATEDGWTDPLGALAAYAAEYQAWCRGDVYGYVIETQVPWQRVDDPTVREDRWEHVDSCWGFYGPDSDVEASAREALAALIAQ